MSDSAIHPAGAGDSEPEIPAAPGDRLLVAGAAGTTAWVLTWVTVQVHGALGWALPFVPGFR